jgi:(1->4)-alpha-D-glucan 1-alpha-D-glucosylmutase
VEYESRAAALDRLRPLFDRVESGTDDGAAAELSRLLEDWPSGIVKLWTLAQALRTRRRDAPLFLDGAYVPLATDPDGAVHLVAFARTHEGRTLLSITPRLLSRLVPPGRAFPLGAMAWKTMRVFLPDTIPATTWRNVFTGERVQEVASEGHRFVLGARLFETLPVAWLVPEER